MRTPDRHCRHQKSAGGICRSSQRTGASNRHSRVWGFFHHDRLPLLDPDHPVLPNFLCGESGIVQSAEGREYFDSLSSKGSAHSFRAGPNRFCSSSPEIKKQAGDDCGLGMENKKIFKPRGHVVANSLLIVNVTMILLYALERLPLVAIILAGIG